MIAKKKDSFRYTKTQTIYLLYILVWDINRGYPSQKQGRNLRKGRYGLWRKENLTQESVINNQSYWSKTKGSAGRGCQNKGSKLYKAFKNC